MPSMTYSKTAPLPRLLRELRPNVAAEVRRIRAEIEEDNRRSAELASRIVGEPAPYPTLTLIRGGAS